MEKATVTTKGQIVIPAGLRKNLRIRQGTQVAFIERDGEIIVRPITDEYIEKMAGITNTNGKLLKSLKAEKTKERKL